MKLGICNIVASSLLFAASILLIVTSISAPVVNGIGILVVDLPEDAKGDEVIFGTFGYCIEHGDENLDDLCSEPRLGYSPLDVTRTLDIVDPSNYTLTTARALTRVMILHPVGAVLCGFASPLALGAGGTLGHSLACLASGLAFFVAALAMVSDFVLFGTVRAIVNEDAVAGSSARFGVAMWCTLAAAVCSAVATLAVVGACCAGRQRGRRADAEKTGDGPEATPAAAPVPVPSPTPEPGPTPEPAPTPTPVEGATKPVRRFWQRR